MHTKNIRRKYIFISKYENKTDDLENLNDLLEEDRYIPRNNINYDDPIYPDSYNGFTFYNSELYHNSHIIESINYKKGLGGKVHQHFSTTINLLKIKIF